MVQSLLDLYQSDFLLDGGFFRTCLSIIVFVTDYMKGLFSINAQLSSIWPIDRTLSGAIILGQSGPGRDDNEGVHRIPQSPSITGTLA